MAEVFAKAYRILKTRDPSDHQFAADFTTLM
jgi:hypothetical protein